MANCPGVRVLIVERILLQFDADSIRARAAYRQFVMEGRGVSVWEDVRGGILPGTEEFVGQMGLLLRETELDPEIRRRECFADRRALVGIFSGVGSDRYIRDVRIHDASVKHGYTLTEISKYLGLHPSTLSRIVKRVVEGLDAQGKVSPSL